GGWYSWSGDHREWFVPGKRLPIYLPGDKGATVPVGWPFQILEFLEEGTILNQPAGNPALAWQMVKATTPSIFFCPSRRGPTRNTRASDAGVGNGMMDYASANPRKDASTDIQGDFWGFQNQWDPVDRYDYYGIIVRSRSCRPTKTKDVTDGMSNTLLIGEKFIPPRDYPASDDPAYAGDDRGWSDGWDHDIARSTGLPPQQDQNYRNLALYASEGPFWTYKYLFGSAHPSNAHFVFGDGSVHAISYNIDAVTFNNLGHRCDGQVTDKRDVN